MTWHFFGVASIPLLVSMKPRNFLASTAKAHFAGFKRIWFSRNLPKTFSKFGINSSSAFALTSMSSTYTSRMPPSSSLNTLSMSLCHGTAVVGEQRKRREPRRWWLDTMLSPPWVPMPPLVLEEATVPSLLPITFNWSRHWRGASSPPLLVVPGLAVVLCCYGFRLNKIDGVVGVVSATRTALVTIPCYPFRCTQLPLPWEPRRRHSP
ncbi:hypothetical protein PIB30_023125 [Stylosanthes scabra]|uniref:Uncharacterized protein n=1 Tax=Stylosanthes scabra TaxID=79078 RepID=A0ABU6QA16_9FABA|nr:hypothetical protein [Stylosanthes scabra]